MREKFGSHYADWRDEHGRRHMKAFPTKAAAQRHTRKMRRAIAKKASHAAKSGPSPMRGWQAAHTRTTSTSSRKSTK